MRSISTCTFTGHILVPGPSGSLRLCKSAILPVCHLLALDGVYRREGEGRLRFVPVPARRVRRPGGCPADVKTMIEALARQTIDRRIAAILNRPIGDWTS